MPKFLQLIIYIITECVRNRILTLCSSLTENKKINNANDVLRAVYF